MKILPVGHPLHPIRLDRFFHRNAAIAALLFVVLTLGMYRDATALFTDQQDIGTGTYTSAALSLEVAKPAGVDLHVSNLVPGDTVDRELIISNSGTVPFTYTLHLDAPAAPAPTLLWTGANGLQFQVIDDGQNQPVGTLAPALSLDSSNPISLGQLNAGQNETIRIRITLPTAADNTYQNLEQSLTLVFYAQQLAGTNR